MNKHCKNCGEELLYESSLQNLRDFCDENCKKEYRREYIRIKVSKHRKGNVNNLSNGNGRQPPNENNRNPYFSSDSGGRKSGSVNSEKVLKDRRSKREKKSERIAQKICSNYSTAQREGFCITFNEPYKSFKKNCPNCPILRQLEKFQLKVL